MTNRQHTNAINQCMTLEERNEEICMRFTTLAEAQPLATCGRIIDYLAREYGLTPQGVRHVLKSAGIETSRPTQMI